MSELNNIFKKLNIGEQMQLNNYINRKINIQNMKNQTETNKMIDEAKAVLDEDQRKMKQYYTEINDKTWQKIETFLHLAMRELRISEERIKKIDTRVLELSNECPDKLLIGEERKSEFKVLEDADFQKMICLLMDSSCRNCKEHSKNCEVHQLLKKYNIPHSGYKGKCKYAYYRIGKKVV